MTDNGVIVPNAGPVKKEMLDGLKKKYKRKKRKLTFLWQAVSGD